MIRLWDNDTVYQESGMFAGSDRINLMFPAAEIIKVSAHCSGKIFENGRDFLHTPGSAEIIRTPDSAIPAFSATELYPTEKLRLHPEPDANAIDNSVGGGYILFNNRNMFALNQIDITYKKSGGVFDPLTDWQSSRLLRTKEKLAGGSSLNITMLGDSISEGFNATKFTGIEPFSPPYIEQICGELSARSNAKINLTNRALASTGIQYTEKIAAQYCSDRADLVVIAYGMNNFNNTPVEKFIEMLSGILDRSRSSNPETEFLIVTFMTGHSRWIPTVPGNDLVYAQAMRKFVATQDGSVALADVQSVWRKFLERKSFYDLTGNGVNHPNDYGHRIYASVLLEILTGEKFL